MTILNSAVQLLRAVPLGTEVRSRARVQRQGRRTALIDIQLLLPDGRPALTGHVLAGLTPG
jgi:acyl-coenzyme A thioesterase PaaI-like protein